MRFRITGDPINPAATDCSFTAPKTSCNSYKTSRVSDRLNLRVAQPQLGSPVAEAVRCGIL